MECTKKIQLDFDLSIWWLSTKDWLFNLMKFYKLEKLKEWIIKSKTFLAKNNSNKSVAVGNYRPITWLPTAFKLLNCILTTVFSGYIFKNSLLLFWEKNLKKKKCKQRKNNLQMVWIDNKRASGSLPHSAIQKCLNTFPMSANGQNFVKEA